MLACANKNSKEWKALVIKFKGDEDLAQAAWNQNKDTINIQRSNSKALASGTKTVSVRPTDEHSYEVGDVLKVKVKGNDIGTRVKVLSIKTVKNFNDLDSKEKDEFARSIGDYKNFEDFKKTDDYAKEDSPLSIRFPETYKFINGKVSGDIISYEKTESLAQNETPESKKVSSLVGHVKTFLEKKIEILKKKEIPNKRKKEAELKRLVEQLKDVEGIDSIKMFIDDAYEKTKEAELMFEKLIKDKALYSKAEMVSRLGAFNEFVSGYSILDEISKADLEEIRGSRKIGLQEDGSYSTQAKLLYSIERKNLLKNDYIETGIPLLADFLLDYKSEPLSASVIQRIKEIEVKIAAARNNVTLKPSVAEKRIKEYQDQIKTLKPHDLNREKLIDQLRVAAKDESALDFMMSPLISSSDSVLALFAKAVKSALEDARQKDIKEAKEYQKEYDEFLASNKKNRDNVAKFNEDIYEIIEVKSKDDDGNNIYKKVKAFVQKYNVTKFEKAKDSFFASLGEKPTDPKLLKEYNKKISIWFRDNTQPKSTSEINDIIRSKNDDLMKGILTKEEYDAWEDSVMSEFYNKESGQVELAYKRELTEPANKYINPKWDAMYHVDGIPSNFAGKYHAFLTNKYFEAQENLPEHFRKGYILPSISKDNIERSLTQNIVNVIKNNISQVLNVKSDDIQYSISGLDGDDVKFLPVHYTEYMDHEDVSSDLLQSVMKFTSMSNKYNALNNISGEISLIKQVVDQRKVVKTNSKGEQIKDAFAAKFGYSEYIIKNGESYSKKHLDSFIDMVVIGEMEKKEELFGKDAGKITNTLLGFSATTTLAVDFIKSVSNNIQGNVQVMIEANSGRHFSKTNLLTASAFYFKNEASMIKDFGKISPDGLASKLIDLYDGIQGEFINKYGQNVSGSIARKLFKKDTLFFNQHIAEHEIQMKTLFALLEAQYVKDNESGELITLLDAYQKYGIDIEDKTDFTDKQRRDIMNTHHALAKRMHGVYNNFDKATIQRYSLGRLLLMYRKYLIPSYKKRYGDLYGDQESGEITEGIYRTFHETFIRDMRDFQFNVAKNWATYSDFEKAQIKRVMAEAAFIISFTALVMVLKGSGDDDKDLKKNWFYNFVLYQAVRQRSETSAYLNPRDAYKAVKSPSALTTTMDRTIDLASQLLFTWDPEKLNYKKKTGVFDKGTNKSWAYTMKLFGLSGYNINPAEAVKSFEGTLNK